VKPFCFRAFTEYPAINRTVVYAEVD
jgi:hypothetical protein